MRVGLKVGASARILGAAVIMMSAAAVGMPAAAQIVSDSVLSRAKVSGTESCAQLTIEFNTSVQYQSHFPEQHGRQLRISLLPIVRSGAALRGRQEEGLRVPRSKLIDVQNISLDASDPSGPKLIIDFDRDVYWTVSQGGDFTSIVIALSGSSGGCSAGGTETEGNTVEVARPILGVSRSVPDQFDINGAYAINLDSKAAGGDFGPVVSSPVFDDYTAYTINENEAGQSWTRLRVGMFASRHDAEQALAQLAGAYPDAWIARTSSSERSAIYRAWLAARSLTGSQKGSTAADPEAASMVERAKAALQAGDTATAISLSQSAVARPESRVTPEA